MYKTVESRRANQVHGLVRCAPLLILCMLTHAAVDVLYMRTPESVPGIPGMVTDAQRCLHASSRPFFGRRALANNMVLGTSVGWTKTLSLVGVGYRASVAGSKLTLNLGYSHPVEMDVPKGLEVKVGAAALFLASLHASSAAAARWQSSCIASGGAA